MSARWAAFRALMALPYDDPDLAHAQLTVLARQIPMLFIILTTNALALAATHIDTAPPFLTIVMPALFCLLCAHRVRFWHRFSLTSVDGAGALRFLRTITRVVAILGLVFTGWSLALYPYGDSYAHCHVAFYMSITVVSCILCLTQHRSAALLLTFLVLIPFTIFFLITENLVLIAMVGNVAIVTWGLIIIMLRNNRSFAKLVVAQRNAQRLSNENLRLAQQDGLTGLPNRRRFMAELDDTLAAAQQSGACFAVGMIDLDRFKAVNDSYGHGAGDRLLEQIGARLATIAGADRFIARLGGDEFGAILKDTASEAAILAFGARLQALLDAPFALNDTALATIGCSIGVATFPQTGQTAEDLFERADYALYDGKQHRKGEIVLFSQALETEIRTSSQIEQALRNADLERELWLAFQPIVDATTNAVPGFESLARWQSPELGAVSPGVFIPIAEHAQLINHITLVLFGKYLDAVRLLPAHTIVSFNLSAHNLSSRATMAKIQEMLRGSGVSPSRVSFEITETALLRDFDLAAETIETLHAMGASIALDDFGAGFSSLGYVHRLKLDKIKIDRSFVSNIENSETAPKIIRSLIDLCRNLEVVCVVEGVETPAQLALLLSLGAKLIQGYLFAKPMRLEAVTAWYESRNRLALPLYPDRLCG
ncbi:EAL domain-containing protein [Acidiphilium sp. PA]|uniref:putative bifunctional diguanylate cyclase/phosphodiesterase n=1 Tax=Acidiphilium sp. PA TaxID=2871705 RepID=UPI002244CDE9|nr:EAL domain-containing protein [Acidiphilium sp. PA]MCW8306790.1 EAL domain-containing protein [Acidiphilium sp. PA]